MEKLKFNWESFYHELAWKLLEQKNNRKELIEIVKKELNKHIGKNVLIEVEAQGAGPVKLNLPDATAFFITPASMEELEKQISERYKDDEASIERRINKAKMDMELASIFKHTVSNESTEEAVAYIKEVLMKKLGKQL